MDFKSDVPTFEEYQAYIHLLKSLDTKALDEGVEVASWSTSAPHIMESEEIPKSRKRGIKQSVLKQNWTEKEIWKKYMQVYKENESLLSTYVESISYLSKDINPITFTLSPQSTPGFKGLTTQQQYDKYILFFKTIRELYNLEFIVFFELYPQSPSDMHCHGFIRTASANKLKDIRTLWKKFHRNCKPNDTRFRDHSQKFEIAHDKESVERWTYYCLKDQSQMIKLGYMPSRFITKK